MGSRINKMIDHLYRRNDIYRCIERFINRYDAVRGLARATQLLRGRAPPEEKPTGTLPGEKDAAKPAEIFKRYVEKNGADTNTQQPPD